MGQRLSDIPHIYGDDCVSCYDPGETPKYMYARFSDIVTCPGAPLLAPNDRVFKMTQKVSYPCVWEYLGPEWRVWYSTGVGPAGNSRLTLQDLANFFYFNDYGPGCPDEGHVWNNEATCPHWQCRGEGGIASLLWTHITTDLLAAINMQKAEDLFMEMFPLVDGNLVFKFCRLRDATNIKIELEPD